MFSKIICDIIYFSLSYFTRCILTPARVVQQSRIFFVNYVFVIARLSVQRFRELAFISSSSVFLASARKNGLKKIQAERWCEIRVPYGEKMLRQPLNRTESVCYFASIFLSARQ